MYWRSVDSFYITKLIRLNLAVKDGVVGTVQQITDCVF